MRTSCQSGAVSRKLVIWLSIPVILVALVFGGWAAVRYKHQRARADWKTATLTRLTGLSLTNKDISHELETLKADRGAGEHQEWTGEQVPLMTNAEYLVYASRHGFNNGFVDHLFLAHGSDGRWLYSTQADIRFAIKLSRRISRRKFSNRARRVIEPSSDHLIAEMHMACERQRVICTGCGPTIPGHHATVAIGASRGRRRWVRWP